MATAKNWLVIKSTALSSSIIAFLLMTEQKERHQSFQNKVIKTLYTDEAPKYFGRIWTKQKKERKRKEKSLKQITKHMLLCFALKTMKFIQNPIMVTT